MHLFEGIWHILENYKESLLCQAATDYITAACFPSTFLPQQFWTAQIEKWKTFEGSCHWNEATSKMLCFCFKEFMIVKTPRSNSRRDLGNSIEQDPATCSMHALNWPLLTFNVMLVHQWNPLHNNIRTGSRRDSPVSNFTCKGSSERPNAGHQFGIWQRTMARQLLWEKL